MSKRNDYKCEEVCKTKLVHCGPKSDDNCTCANLGRAGSRQANALGDYDEQVISLCGIHDEVKNAFLSLDFVAKRMENRENHNKVSKSLINRLASKAFL